MAQLPIGEGKEDPGPKTIGTESIPVLRVVKAGGNNFELEQELVNSTIHAFGVLFGIAAIPFLASIAARSPDVVNLPGAFVYGFSFLMVFTFSTLYHGFREPVVKKLFEVLDHISIYFFIAGTYTPLILAYMNNATGMLMLWLLWGLVLAGSTFKICFGCRYNILSTVFYLLMGWIVLWTGTDFFKAMPPQVMNLVLAGGVLYSVGVVFFLWEKFKWNHAIWHSLVLAAAVCHYLAIYKTMIP
jgi:hemolysin III